MPAPLGRGATPPCGEAGRAGEQPPELLWGGRVKHPGGARLAGGAGALPGAAGGVEGDPWPAPGPGPRSVSRR